MSDAQRARGERESEEEAVTMTHTSVVLAVRNMDASMRFYADVLGCDREFANDEWAFLTRDKFRVMLGHCPAVTPASEIGDHSYVAYITVDDVDALHADILRRGGATFTSAPKTEPWGMREFGLRTPDGHRMMFGQDVE
jgi:uncharacterized glyoxalase superfamily protein PhnB